MVILVLSLQHLWQYCNRKKWKSCWYFSENCFSLQASNHFPDEVHVAFYTLTTFSEKAAGVISLQNMTKEVVGVTVAAMSMQGVIIVQHTNQNMWRLKLSVSHSCTYTIALLLVCLFFCYLNNEFKKCLFVYLFFKPKPLPHAIL